MAGLTCEKTTMPQAVVLAGGLGTRLRPLTDNLPKPMVRVAGRPFLEHQLRLLKGSGVRRVLLLVGYLGSLIEDHFGDGSSLGMEISYSCEGAPLGTGGALKLAETALDETFILLNGDTLLDLDYQSFVRSFEQADRTGMVVVSHVWEGAVKGNVRLGPGNAVAAYEKRGNGSMPFVEAGVSAYRKRVLELIPKGRPVSLEQEVYPRLIERGELWAYPCDQRFHDMGTVDGLASLARFLG